MSKRHNINSCEATYYEVKNMCSKFMYNVFASHHIWNNAQKITYINYIDKISIKLQLN